jgi:hypothetical protein
MLGNNFKMILKEERWSKIPTFMVPYTGSFYRSEVIACLLEPAVTVCECLMLDTCT